jgi:hypothetical protein
MEGQGVIMDTLNTMDEIITKFLEKELRDVTWAALQELDRACIKFPTWPAKLVDYKSDEIGDIRKRLQEINDGKDEKWNATANSIIMEELAETLEAAQKGDLVAARAELIQATAMLLRLYVHLPHYCQAAKGGA